MTYDQAVSIVEMDAEGDAISVAAKVLLVEVARLREQLRQIVDGPWLDQAAKVARIEAAMKFIDGTYAVPAPVGRALQEISNALQGKP